MEKNSLLDAFNQIFSYQNFDKDNIDYTAFDSKFELLDRLADVENSSVAVLDMYQKKYVYLRSKFTDKLGYDLNKAFAMGPEYFFSLIHPEDIPVIIDTYQQTFGFILSLPVAERKDYKAILNFRLRNAQNKYITVILQLVVLELDKKGNLWLILILDDLLSNKTKFDKVNRSLVNIRNGKHCLFNIDLEKNKAVLSTREIEVLDLVSKGFLSKEIADKLFISVNTVNNHRQKILEKVNASNTTEAVTYARNLGLI
jgi:DNA-binding CsgD family transcriptional regulator